MMFKSPQAFYDAVIGKSIDMDGAYGAQCWDLFDFYCAKQGVTCSRYCALTGFAGDLYKLRYQYGYDKYFEFFYPKNAKRGDWYFSDRHVARFGMCTQTALFFFWDRIRAARSGSR